MMSIGKYVGPPWRNWLARSAVNRKVGGSSPPGGDYFGLSIEITTFTAYFVSLKVKLIFSR
jgi:hypothetical protein